MQSCLSILSMLVLAFVPSRLYSQQASNPAAAYAVDRNAVSNSYFDDLADDEFKLISLVWNDSQVRKNQEYPPVSRHSDRRQKNSNVAFNQTTTGVQHASYPRPKTATKVSANAVGRDLGSHIQSIQYEAHDSERQVFVKQASLSQDPDNHANPGSEADVFEFSQQPFWWQANMGSPLLDGGGTFIRVSLDQLVFGALNNSKKIKVAQINGFVEQERVTQVDAQFDWTLFAQSLFTDTKQKTGSDLDAGNNIAQLEQLDLANNIGIRRTNRSGGRFEAFQDIQLLENNSLFLNPNDQALTRLTLRYTQPLRRDGGNLVNEGRVLLAQLDSNATSGDSQAEIAEILTQVVEGYWQIYRLRSRYIVQDKLIRNLRQLLEEIKRRSKIDATRSLIGQAEAELANQLATQGQNRIQLIQAQLRLVRIVGDRNLGQISELIPITHPELPNMEPDVSAALSIGMKLRPEVRAATSRVERSGLLNKIRMQQLLPRLALVLESSVNGVNGEFDVARSLGDQFSEGAPTYSVGFNYEIPIGNRSASSRARETELLLFRELANLDDTIDQVTLDVKSAVSGLEGVNRQYSLREDSIRRAQDVLNSLMKRRNVFPKELDQISQLFAREILDAQQRVTNAESELIDLVFGYSSASIQLRRATGTLISSYQEAAPQAIPTTSACSCGQIECPGCSNFTGNSTLPNRQPQVHSQVLTPPTQTTHPVQRYPLFDTTEPWR